MHIFLYDPPVTRPSDRWDDVVSTPLSSCLISGYTAASLMACGHGVELLEREKDLGSLRNALVAVHLIYQWEETQPLLHSLHQLKQQGAIRTLLVYGLFPSAAYAQLLGGYPFIDGVIVGEPEITLPALAERIHGGKPWKDTRGVAFHSRAGIQFKPRPSVRDLDRLPFPLRKGLVRGTAYLAGSRGCYGQCSFCTIHSLYGARSHWRGRSPENILDEMIRIRLQFGDPYYYFADANFFGPPDHGSERALDLAQLIQDRVPDARFGLECRADNVQEKLFSRLRQAGLTDVFLGVESFTEAGLKRLRKGVSPTQNVRAVRTLQGLGLCVSVGFILFDPDTTLDEVRQNFDTLRELDLLSFPSNTAHLLSHRMFVLKGTGLLKGRLPAPFEQETEFKDARVKRLYELTVPACKKVLRELEGEDFENPDSSPYSAENRQLIQLFEETLGSLERRKRRGRATGPKCAEASCAE